MGAPKKDWLTDTISALYDARPFLDPELKVAIINSLAAFKSNGNPAEGLRALTLLRRPEIIRAGIYPPHELLDWLAEAAESYLNGKEKRFDTALGLSAKGKADPRKRLPIDRWLDACMKEIWQLRMYFNPLSVSDACEMVAGRMAVDREALKKTLNKGQTVWPPSEYGAETLQRYYEGKHGQPWREIPEEDKDRAYVGIDDPRTFRRQLLANYPTYTWEHILTPEGEHRLP